MTDVTLNDCLRAYLKARRITFASPEGKLLEEEQLLFEMRELCALIGELSRASPWDESEVTQEIAPGLLENLRAASVVSQ